MNGADGRDRRRLARAVYPRRRRGSGAQARHHPGLHGLDRLQHHRPDRPPPGGLRGRGADRPAQRGPPRRAGPRCRREAGRDRRSHAPRRTQGGARRLGDRCRRRARGPGRGRCGAGRFRHGRDRRRCGARADARGCRTGRRHRPRQQGVPGLRRLAHAGRGRAWGRDAASGRLGAQRHLPGVRLRARRQRREDRAHRLGRAVSRGVGGNHGASHARTGRWPTPTGIWAPRFRWTPRR